eukprot:Skav219361  [mRNA]  locus=scaffold76:562287:564302:- [translate_table: standard]
MTFPLPQGPSLCCARNSSYNVSSEDSLLFVTSIGFDLSCYDIFGSLAAGSTIHICPSALSPRQIFQLLVTKKISFWDSAPQVLQQLETHLSSSNRNDDLRYLRLVFLSGDWVPMSLMKTLLDTIPGAQLVGLGGATEVTVWSNNFEVKELDPGWRSIPYGRPIWNHQYYCCKPSLEGESKLYLESGDLEHQTLGMPGELYIAGIGVAQGYVGRPDLTDERFLRNSFHGGRMYRTGDMVRFMPLKPWGKLSVDRLQELTATWHSV